MVSAVCQAGERTVIEWRFDKAGDFLGWQRNEAVADAAVRGGLLHGRASGADPILIGPVFEISAAAEQCFEICLKGTAPANAELYWTETLQGQYGGFSGEKHRLLHTLGDNQFHVYRIWPFWHAAKKIIRLRIDPPDAGEFDIRWIRIVQRDGGPASSVRSFSHDQIAARWRDSGDVEGQSLGPILLSPRLAIPAAENAFVCVRMATDRTASGRLLAVSSSKNGWEGVSFSLRPDGQLHSYNLPASTLANWHGEILYLGLQVPSGSATRIESIEVARQPRGPAEFEVSYLGPTEGINRAGRPVGITCTLRNLGGDLAQDVTATLAVPEGVTVLDGAEKSIDRLSLHLPKTVQWKIQGQAPGKVGLTVKVAAAQVPAVSSTTTVELTKAPNVVRTGYVPEPRPVQSKYEIGAFYFPGFATLEQWRPIRDFPCRKPILGWYDEANPECADWQIKWAVEHGVNFFMVDWYWCRGNRSLEHWLHNAYGKARYRKYLKWAVMWANHNPPNTHSLEDWRKVTQYWIDHYFKMPEYYRIDNRPAVWIWAPSNVRGDVGGSSQAAKLYAMSQEMAKAAGFEGIYFVAMSAHENPQATQQLIAEGYRGATTYHGFQLAWQRAGSDRFPYAALLDTCPEVWREAEKSAVGLRYLPIVDTGWDSRPWHGDKALAAHGRTPELFGKLCRLARQRADATGQRIIALGPWNEWGEGSYIEPYAEYGFGDLDQLREAFCEPGNWPENIVPSDVGLGPYDLPQVAPKTSWEFNTDGTMDGWTANSHISDPEVKEGTLRGRSTGHDPILQVGGLVIEADVNRRLALRMRSDRPERVQLFWVTRLESMSEDASASINVAGDGQFHDYEIDLGKNPHWTGIVHTLRLDPATGPGATFAIDYVRLRR